MVVENLFIVSMLITQTMEVLLKLLNKKFIFKIVFQFLKQLFVPPSWPAGQCLWRRPPVNSASHAVRKTRKARIHPCKNVLPTYCSITHMKLVFFSLLKNNVDRLFIKHVFQ